MDPVSPTPPTHAPARVLAAMLCALMAVIPVEGKRSEAQAASSSDTASSTSHKPKKAGSESTQKPAHTTGHAATGTKKPASSTSRKPSTHHSATAPRGKKKYVSPAERRRRAA